MNTAELNGLLEHCPEGSKLRLRNLIEKISSGCLPPKSEDKFFQRLKQLQRLAVFEKESSDEDKRIYKTIGKLLKIVPVGTEVIRGVAYSDHANLRTIARKFEAGKALSSAEVNALNRWNEKYSEVQA